MKCRVLHISPILFAEKTHPLILGTFTPTKLELELDYKAVLTVDLEGSHDELLQRLFLETNSIHSAWVDNWGTAVEKGQYYRSTSVGDVIELDGTSYVVANIGFTKL